MAMTTKQVIAEFDERYNIVFEKGNKSDLILISDIKSFLTSKLELRTKEIIELIQENENGEDANILLVAKLIATLKSTSL